MDWEHIASTFGIPVLILFALGVAMWKVGKFFSTPVQQWILAQASLANSLSEVSREQCQLLRVLLTHAKQGHSAIRRTLEGLEEMQCTTDKARDQFNRAKDCLLDEGK